MVVHRDSDAPDIPRTKEVVIIVAILSSPVALIIGAVAMWWFGT